MTKDTSHPARCLHYTGLLLAVLALNTGCTTTHRQSPFAGAPFPFTDATTSAGFEADYGGRLLSPDKEKRIRCVAERLLARTEQSRDAGTYRFIILASDTPNAFSFSDKRIYLTSGLYPYLETDDLLAAILAHEIGHIVARHGQTSQRRERDRLRCEIEADRIAIQLLTTAGFDPQALPTLIRSLSAVQPPSWADSRLQILQQILTAK